MRHETVNLKNFLIWLISISSEETEANEEKKREECTFI